MPNKVLIVTLRSLSKLWSSFLSTPFIVFCFDVSEELIATVFSSSPSLQQPPESNSFTINMGAVYFFGKSEATKLQALKTTNDNHNLIGLYFICKSTLLSISGTECECSDKNTRWGKCNELSCFYSDGADKVQKTLKAFLFLFYFLCRWAVCHRLEETLSVCSHQTAEVESRHHGAKTNSPPLRLSVRVSCCRH
jgi:hypothetical protein